MRIRFLSPALPLLLFFFISSLASANKPTPPDEFETSTFPYSLTLYLSPLASNSPNTPPTPYGTLSYNPSTLQGSFTPSSSSPPPKSLPAFAKLGLYDTDTQRWRSAVVAKKELLEDGGCVVLHLGGEKGEEAKYVGFMGGGETTTGSKRMQVKVMKGEEGPGAVLNKPVVVDENGKVPEPEVEKTFFQK
jgi:hypothetical protein